MQSTSFENSSKWYNSCVGKKGHYYHREVLLPRLEKISDINAQSKVVDFGCGQGVLERALPKKIKYVGLDLSSSLIAEANRHKKNPEHQFFRADITQRLSLPMKYFTHAYVILALQNIQKGKEVIKNISKHLCANGHFFIILNHPCFRIPKHTSWVIDEEKSLQFRQTTSYMSPLEIPIQTHPGKDPSALTLSFHYPVSTYCNWLCENNLVIENIEEICSNKKSTGKKATMEDRARKEFPLFMLIRGKKIG